MLLTEESSELLLHKLIKGLSGDIVIEGSGHEIEVSWSTGTYTVRIHYSIMSCYGGTVRAVFLDGMDMWPALTTQPHRGDILNKDLVDKLKDTILKRAKEKLDEIIKEL